MLDEKLKDSFIKLYTVSSVVVPHSELETPDPAADVAEKAIAANLSAERPSVSHPNYPSGYSADVFEELENALPGGGF